MYPIQRYTLGGMQAHLITLLSSPTCHEPRSFLAADHNDHILLIAYRASAFLIPKIDTESDHGRSDTTFRSHRYPNEIRCTLGSLETKAIVTSRSSSGQRKDNANVLRAPSLSGVFAPFLVASYAS